ncbi:MAG: MMPL family transporter, partial [Desulfobacteraceae bacterium]|nr:MMPL family transporter [Desulfobacteraceae bacterium]
LARLREFQSVLEKIPGVYRVDSLFSIPNLKGEEGVLYVNPFVNQVPETLEEAQVIKADALRNSLMLDNLVSRDGSAIAFNLFLYEDIGQDEKRFSIQVDEAISTIAPYMEKVFQLGEPYTKRVLYEGHMRDQRRLVPLSFVLYILLSFLIWRSFSLAGMTLLTSGLSILWTLGFMGLVGLPITRFTAMMPPLLIAVGSTEDVHLFSEYLTGIRKTGTRPDAIRHMIGKGSLALFLTALTTFSGFLAISLNKFIILQQFGFVCAFGLFVNPLITFLTAPVWLRYFGPRHTGGRGSGSVNTVFSGLAGTITRLIRAYRWRTFGLLAGGILFVGFFS